MTQIERLLARLQQQVATFQRDRAQIQRRLDAVDMKMRMLGGGASTRAGSGPTIRARNEKSLVASITEVLSQAKKPLSIGEILEGVHDSGYRSNSANFRAGISLALIKERKHFARAGRGMYAVKK